MQMSQHSYRKVGITELITIIGLLWGQLNLVFTFPFYITTQLDQYIDNQRSYYAQNNTEDYKLEKGKIELRIMRCLFLHSRYLLTNYSVILINIMRASHYPCEYQISNA